MKAEIEKGADTKEDILDIDEVMNENEVTVAYDITSYPSDLTLSVINEMFKNGDIEIPEFQRNFVWTIQQASLLIESFLVGLPVPQVFFYVDDRNKGLVIDGQQRILSVVYYFEGFFGSENIHGKRQIFRLSGLEDDNPYSGKRFADLDEVAQRKLKSAVLRAINIRQLKPKDDTTSMYHIFERLNTGGTPLKPQEIRNCVFRGDFSRILKSLNLDENWRKILGKKTVDKHQKDVELILRIFALSMYFDQYEKPMKEFLNKVMNNEKAGTSQNVKKFSDLFPKVAKAILDNFGDKPFSIRGPVNTAVLDAVFCALLKRADALPGNLRHKLSGLLEDQDFKLAISSGTSDTKAVQTRFQKAQTILS